MLRLMWCGRLRNCGMLHKEYLIPTFCELARSVGYYGVELRLTQVS